MHRRGWIITLVIMAGLMGIGGTWMLLKNREAASTNPYARDSFLAELRNAGLQIERTAGTNAYALFRVDQEAELGVWTNQGFMDVVVYRTDLGDRFAATKVGEYSWRLDGLDHPVQWNSNRAWYFIAHGDLLIATDSAELAETVRGLSGDR